MSRFNIAPIQPSAAGYFIGTRDWYDGIVDGERTLTFRTQEQAMDWLIAMQSAELVSGVTTETGKE